MKKVILSLSFGLISLIAFSANTVGDTCSIITFAIIGDYGSNDSNEFRVAQMVKNWDPDFIVSAGDNSYDDDSGDKLRTNVGKYYGDYIYNAKDTTVNTHHEGKAYLAKKNLFFPCMGNHDAKSDESFKNYLKYFNIPKNYTVSWGPCKMYFFYSGPHGHSNGNGEFDGETKAFIKSNLTSQVSNDSFQLVFFHHPPYCSTKIGNPKIREAFDFDTLNVDAVICGHEHLYERIARKAGIADAPPIYIVCGSGGAELEKEKVIEKRSLEPKFYSAHLDYEHFGAIKATIICTLNIKIIYFEYYTVDSAGYHLDDKYFLKK